ncbi:MAG: ceramidase domain-containing protein [Pseudomonadota bacterium]
MDSFIDIYCERLGPGLLAEPINAITNLSFFIAASFCLHLAYKKDALDWRSGALITLVYIIGTGSTLFHTTATFWAMLSDALPILFYQIVFLQVYSSRVIGLSCRYSSGLLALFLLTVFMFGQLPSDWLNGSIGYFPALLFLYGLSYWHWRFASVEKNLMLQASGIFTVSLFFRSIDMYVCDSLPLGTHFLWHILNGVVLYMTTRAFILNAQQNIKQSGSGA